METKTLVIARPVYAALFDGCASLFALCSARRWTDTHVALVGLPVAVAAEIESKIAAL